MRATTSLLILMLAVLVLASLNATARRHDAQEPGKPDRIEFRVDVNRDDVLTLTLLPGIGQAIAQSIIEHRQTRGPFASVDELIEVRGIGATTLERLRPYVVCSPVHPAAGGFGPSDPAGYDAEP